MALVHIYNRTQRRNPRLFKPRVNLDSFREFEIISRYRLDRLSVKSLVDVLKYDIERGTRRSQSVDPETQVFQLQTKSIGKTGLQSKVGDKSSVVLNRKIYDCQFGKNRKVRRKENLKASKENTETVLIGLRFLAKGSFFSELADIHGVSRSTVCMIIETFIDAVNNNLNNIKFPKERQELIETKLGFYKTCGLASVVGAVDGTMIPIKAPTENEHVYVCRKGYHAVNVQAVVDSKMRFLDVVAKWPGSQHDAFIFDNCALKTYLEHSKVGYLLGDSGYPLKEYLITPLLNPATDAEILFNTRHVAGRQIVEKAFGVLKSRFRCLHKSGGNLPFKPEKCLKVTAACMRLHNFCMSRNVPLLEPLIQEDIDIVHQQQFLPDRNGRERQRDLVQFLQGGNH